MDNNENSNNNTTSNKYQNKSILLIALSRHKKGLMLLVLTALISTSLAWFYQNLTVGMRVDGEVESWNVSVGESAIYEFSLNNLYPGVVYTPEEKKIPIINSGDTPAYLFLEISNLYLFNHKLDSSEYSIVRYAVLNNGERVLASSVNTGNLEDGSDITIDEQITGYVYSILGFPFTLDFEFPVTKLEAGNNTEIGISFNWDFSGATTLVPKMLINENGVVKESEIEQVPKCISNVFSSEILNYVSDKKVEYKELGFSIDDTEKDASQTLDNTDFSISTCDILDTYFGEKSVDFQDMKKLYQTTIDETLEKNPKASTIEIENLTTEEKELFIFKDLYIELSLTVAQAGGYGINVGTGSSNNTNNN